MRPMLVRANRSSHRMVYRIACFALVLSSLASLATSQLPGPGLTWLGSISGGVGSYLPSCANLPVNAVRGETADLRVWGDPQAPFALLAAASGTQCLPIPGFGNALVLDPPLVTIATGILSQTSPCLSCPPGFELVRLFVPLGLPLGAAISFQALTNGATRLGFTVAITAKIT